MSIERGLSDNQLERKLRYGLGLSIIVLWALIGAVLVGMTGAQAASDNRTITLDGALSQDIIEYKGQKTYLRVHLQGHKPDEERERTPVNIALVIDKSGSMNGAKLRQAKQAAILAVRRLRADDVISVIAYDDRVQVLVSATTLEDKAGVIRKIRAMRAGGRTALYAGVKSGASELEAYMSRNRVNRVVLLSDGLANVGPSKPAQLGELGRKLASEGISVTTIGLGLGYNEDLMAKLAYNSDGNHAFVEKPSDLVKIFDAEFGDVLSVIAQDIEIIIRFRSGFVPLRALGREAHIKGQTVRLRLNQLYGAQEKYVVLEFDAKERAGEQDLRKENVASIKLNYLDMASKKRREAKRDISIQFSASREKAKNSINKTVATDVTQQIATEVNERAVKLRDKGDVAGARALLQTNSAYLKKQAKELGARNLSDLAAANETDARNLEGRNWNRSRKAMRARQHKLKTQQAY